MWIHIGPRCRRVSSCAVTAFRLAVLVPVAWVPVAAQSLIDEGDLIGARTTFDQAPSRTPMRCSIGPVRPALNFALQFQTGYKIDIPLNQFRGTGHKLNILVRVTPDGREPAYLSNIANLPDVPVTKADGEIFGKFVVGEGDFGVEALVEDDSQRVCRGKWRLQTKLSGSERELISTTQPGTVEEFSPVARRGLKTSPKIGRLTVMIDAAPLAPSRSALQPDDIELLMGSFTALLEQLPAQSVRLAVFNLDQKSVLFRKELFAETDIEELATTLGRIQLARVDYSALQKPETPASTLIALMHEEAQNPSTSNVVIVMGPQTRNHEFISPGALLEDQKRIPPAYYLRFLPSQPLQAIAGRSGPIVNDITQAGRGSPLPNQSGPAVRSIPSDIHPSPYGIKDSVQQLIDRIKGETITVRTPHDFADAIHRITTQLGDSAKPSAGVPRPSVTQVLPDTQAPAAVDKTPQPPDSIDADPTEVLMHVRDQVLEHGKWIPNHTCIETIQRDRYEPVIGRSAKSCDTLMARRKQPNFSTQLRPDTTDKLRLDVALADGGEIYSWAGANRFDERDLDEWTPEGAIGTGPFATLLLSIFEDRSSKFVFDGETSVAERQLMEYSFGVPQDESRYRVKAGKDWIITGYTGTLLVDPRTAELVRFNVRTEELPPSTGTCETDTSLEYGMVALGGNDYLLPAKTVQTFVGRDGAEDENRIAFASCREYRAASTLSFGEGQPTVQTSRGEASETSGFPAGLPVTIELTTRVQADVAAAGDRIEGRLSKPIRAPGQQATLGPQGARVAGRLMRVEKHYSHPAELTVALRWETLEINGIETALQLIPDRRVANPGTVGLGGFIQRGMTIELPLPTESRYGVYHFPGSQVTLESGFQTEWLTQR